MTIHVSVTGRVSVHVPAETVLTLLWDLKSLGLYEPKVDSVWVTPKTDKTGTYATRGRFAGLPWGGRFSYELNRHGFHSKMIRGPLGMRVQGGFVVKSEDADVCVITHYERYQFPRWLFPLILPVRAYLLWVMKKELRNVATLLSEKSRILRGGTGHV